VKQLSTIIFASLLPLTACAIDPTDGDELVEDEPEVSTVSSNLCSDGAANGTVAFSQGAGELTVTSALATNNYDHPACSDRYAVEVTGVNAATGEFFVTADWGENLPTTQSACELAVANVQTHQYAVTSFNCGGQICFPVYGWSPVGGEITMNGQWVTSPFDPSVHWCELAPQSPLPTFQPSAFRSKVRVSVRAYAWALFFPSYRRAEAGVISNNVPN
jgi:hypothetical protein